MPDIGAIKKFSEILKSLGSETIILAERGEKIEEVPIPDEGLPDDLSALLGTPGALGDMDAADIDLSAPEDDEELDQLDNIEDFLMPSLDQDELADEDLGADLSADTGGLLPGGDDFEFPGSDESLTVGEEVAGGGDEPGMDEIISDDFALPDNLEESTSALTGDGFDLPSPEEALPLDDGFSVDDLSFAVEEEPPAEEDSIPDEFSLPGDLESSLPEESFTPDLSEDSEAFDRPGDISSLPGEESVIADEFAIPDDLAEPLAEDALSDEFALPDLGEQPGLNLGEEGLGGEASGESGEEFMLDDFSLDTDTNLTPPLESSPAESGIEDFGSDLLDDFALPSLDADEVPGGIEKPPSSSKDEFVIDDFSMPSIDEDFEIDSLDEELGGDIPPVSGKTGDDKPPAGAGPGDTIQLTDKEFAKLQLTLETLPRNLKIIVQDLIGTEQISGQLLKELLGLLTAGASPLKIADFVSKITGEKIELPRSFEKKTGLEFSAEKRSLKYIFRENIVPLLKVFIPALGILILLIYVAVRYFVIPWQADQLYKQGLEYILEDNNPNLGDKTFDEAHKIYRKKQWFYTYAEAYEEKNEYSLARRKYEQLLNLGWKDGEIDFLTKWDDKGIVDYAKFETRQFNFAKSEKLLDHLLQEKKYNKEGLFAAGDNYLKWAKYDESKYEQARLAYATLFRSNARRQDIDFRFLRYFIRVDNYEEVKALKDKYQQNKKIEVDPEIYTELGGYLLDKEQPGDVKDILLRAKEIREDIPELHFHLSRFYHMFDEDALEEYALNNTLFYLQQIRPLSTEQREMNIEALNRLGKLYYSQKKIIDAENSLLTAREIIERNQKNSTLGKKAAFGEVYYNLGDIYYYDALDYDTAQKMYLLAADNYYSNPELYYKQGYIQYINQDYHEALLSFYRSEETLHNNINLLFSLGNTLYNRNDFFAAQGYYTHLLNLLEQKRNSISYLQPEEIPEHLQLINYIMRTYNNLAVTLQKLSQRPKNPAKQTEALVYLTKSSEHYDILKRLLLAPETMERDKETKNIAYLNQRKILYPSSDFQLSLYKENPTDSQKQGFRDDWFSLPLQ